MIPLPSPDADSAAFWKGLAGRELLLQHCADCNNVQYYQQQLCRNCGGTRLVHKPASGRGKVHSFSIVHRAPGPVFQAKAPYAVLLVELEEGPRMISTFCDGPVADVAIDLPVELAFDPITDEITLPRFRKAG
ncbi:MAG: OB-fold domain-containing protein [Amaricoccus sp.]